MGKLLPQFQKSIIEDVVYSITSNVANYYAFAANPIAYSGATPDIANNDYTTTFVNDWQMLFGKQLANSDVLPVITNIPWTYNTFYNRYDNLSTYLTNYYVVTPPAETGGDYNIYKCLDNAGGVNSTAMPDQKQPNSFYTTDGYLWRYIATITDSRYTKFATDNYVPIVANGIIVAGAYTYSGIETVVITNSGTNYQCYANGIIQQNPNTTVVQIENNRAVSADFYTGCAMYIYNTDQQNAQLKLISRYVVNTSGKYVYFSSPANTQSIMAGVTQYDIAPAVIFDTDADVKPIARCFVNPSTNTIANVQIIEPGYGVSWCNVSIQSNTTFGSGANVYAIIPPSGGHGSNPINELQAQGMAISFTFSNTEYGTILGNTIYNKIGLIKNPYTATEYGTKSNYLYSANAFSSVLTGNVTMQFTVGDTVIGQTSKARGTVAFCNSTILSLTGDKYFANGETVISATSISTNSQLIINTRGDVYTKGLQPLYVQNISNVQRDPNAAESFKLIIKI
jgi:hypothetical protein